MSYPQNPASTGKTSEARSSKKVAIPVDFSAESAIAVKRTVDYYIRFSGGSVVILHVHQTSGDKAASAGEKLDDELAILTSKAHDLAKPLVNAQIPYKVHVVTDHQVKERLCFEIKKLRCDLVIMGRRGSGAARGESNGKIGSVCYYCVQHCNDVMVVYYPSSKNTGKKDCGISDAAEKQSSMTVASGRHTNKQSLPAPMKAGGWHELFMGRNQHEEGCRMTFST